MNMDRLPSPSLMFLLYSERMHCRHSPVSAFRQNQYVTDALEKVVLYSEMKTAAMKYFCIVCVCVRMHVHAFSLHVLGNGFSFLQELECSTRPTRNVFLKNTR